MDLLERLVLVARVPEDAAILAAAAAVLAPEGRLLRLELVIHTVALDQAQVVEQAPRVPLEMAMERFSWVAEVVVASLAVAVVQQVYFLLDNLEALMV